MSEKTREGSPRGFLDVTEAQIAAIWCDVLNVTDVDSDDNFVELGGDSIAATLCLNRLRRTVDHGVSVSALLAPEMTLRQLAVLLAAAVGGTAAEAAS